MKRKRLTEAKALLTSIILKLILLNIVFIGSQANEESTSIRDAAPGQVLNEYIIIDSNYENKITIKTFDINDGWILSPTDSIDEKVGKIIIDGDGKWNIFVTADGPSGGHLTEYDPKTSNYVQNGLKLTKPLKIKVSDGEDEEVDLSQGGLLVKGSGHQELNLIFKQEMIWGDRSLTSGRTYRLVVHFIVSLDILE